MIREFLEEVAAGDFIDSLERVNERADRRRRLSDYAKATSDKKVGDALGLHDVLNSVFILNEGDDSHLSPTHRALQGVYLIYAL